MNVFTWADKKVKAQTIWDIGVLKFFCTIVGMILGAYVSTWVIQNVWWLVGVAAASLFWLIIRFFKA